MRGQTELTELRMSGYRPEYVWVFLLDTDCSTRFFMDAEHSIELSGMPEIHIGASENLWTLDLRILIDVTVLLQGTDADRLREAYARTKTFSPRRIITSSATVFHDNEVSKCTT